MELSNMNLSILKKIIELCGKYENTDCLTPSEFVTEYEDEDETVLLNFLNFQRHNQILEEIVDHFVECNGIKINLNKLRFKLLFYILIFVFEPPDATRFGKIFIVFNKITHTSKILLYYSDEQNQIHTAKTACKYFDNEYVLNNFVLPILNKKDHFEKLYNSVLIYEDNLHKRKTTIPIEMNVAKKTMKIPAAPVNTPVETELFRSNPVPKTTYHPDLTVQKALSEEHEKNQAKALELLEEVKKMPDFGKRFIPKEPENNFELKTLIKRPERIPVKQNVSIKANLTTIMREAALYAKEKESCIKEINEIMKGGVDTELIKTFEKEIREEEATKHIEETERKKLMCLLSHEEAKIAKCQVKANNQLKYYEILEEREQLKAHLEEWKRKEKELYKIKIEKAHETKRKAKESERKMIEKKQSDARLIQWESKVLMEKAMEQKEQELAKKIHIIQEIKAIHQVRKIDTSKEFDKTECPDLGLLCQMSISELEERLILMKFDEKKKLEQKREEISKKKEEKLRKIREAKEFIEQQRSEKVKPQKKEIKVPEESEEIRRLKKRIEDAKRLREACEMCPCKPCPFIVAHGSNK